MFMKLTSRKKFVLVQNHLIYSIKPGNLSTLGNLVVVIINEGT